MKLGILIFKYLVTSFKCHPKGVSSSGCANLFLASAILKSRKRRGVRSEKRIVIYGFSLVVVSYTQHVLWYHLVATRPQMVKSLCFHVIPGWVRLTHTVLEGFITEYQSHTYYIECLKRDFFYNKYGLRPSK